MSAKIKQNSYTNAYFSIGTFGEVYKGTIWNRIYAIKTISAKILSDTDLELFHKEVELMRYREEMR